ncbi:MAG: Hsp70 family protein, partial [Proteobacteria bacterium]|nr:Hsp70 family protein [Desulfobulbaceae bacterium]MBU4152424.1 Hsp70 family protein [Pseudomonadota bacterium]
GILHVSAKDLGTGKQQSIKITASSGLSEAEISRMTSDAEVHAEEDKKRKALIEAKNQADSMIYATGKSLKEVGDKVDEATRKNVEEATEKLKKTMTGDDTDAIKADIEALTQASHKLAEVMYSQASKEQPGGSAGAGGTEPPKDDNVVDADFEEVK